MTRASRVSSIILMTMSLAAVVGASDGRGFGDDWSNPNRGVDESVFAFADLVAPFENQSALWIARFDDGGYFYSHIFNYKFVVYEKWGVAGVLVTADGKRYMAKEEIDRGALKFSRESLDFTSGPASQSGKYPRYRYVVKSKELSVDLTYSNLTPGFTPGGDGTVWYDAERTVFLKNASQCPWAKVEGKVTAGGETFPVSGQGYADRDHANQLFTKQIKELHSYRAWPVDPATGLSMSCIEYISGPQYDNLRATWFALMKKGEIIMATPDFEIEKSDFVEHPETGFKYPRSWTFKAVSGDGMVIGRYRTDMLIDVLDVMNEIPVPLRPIARKFFARPVFYRMVGWFEGEYRSGTIKVPLKIEGLYKAVYTK